MLLDTAGTWDLLLSSWPAAVRHGFANIALQYCAKGSIEAFVVHWVVQKAPKLLLELRFFLQELAAYVAEGADDDTEPVGVPVSEVSDSEAGKGPLAALSQVWRVHVFRITGGKRRSSFAALGWM